ncbi:MAG: hydrolase [Planctomycetes bacterium]|nr:hydrolase [Planctomycetota bacterium]
MRWQLLVVDHQKAFVPHIAGWEGLIDRSRVMIRAARALEIPITATEQNREKLGPLVPEIAGELEGVPTFDKMTFSSFRDDAARERIRSLDAPRVLIVGIETHVCVLQTALDLVREGFEPHVLADAVGSRRAQDRETALARLRAAGVVVSTVEAAIYEVLERAGTDAFRRILPIVR